MNGSLSGQTLSDVAREGERAGCRGCGGADHVTEVLVRSAEAVGVSFGLLGRDLGVHGVVVPVGRDLGVFVVGKGEQARLLRRRGPSPWPGAPCGWRPAAETREEALDDVGLGGRNDRDEAELSAARAAEGIEPE